MPFPLLLLPLIGAAIGASTQLKHPDRMLKNAGIGAGIGSLGMGGGALAGGSLLGGAGAAGAGGGSLLGGAGAGAGGPAFTGLSSLQANPAIMGMSPGAGAGAGGSMMSKIMPYLQGANMVKGLMPSGGGQAPGMQMPQRGPSTPIQPGAGPSNLPGPPQQQQGGMNPEIMMLLSQLLGRR